MKTETITLSGGERKYRVKKESLSKLEDSINDPKTGKSRTFTQFEKHLIQEGIKQVVFAQGSEEIDIRSVNSKGEVVNSKYQRVIPKEIIQFLLDYDMIEEYKF